MLDAQVNLLENAVIRYFATGEVPQRIGTRHPLSVPFQAFPTADGYVVVAGVRKWPLFCALVDCDELVGDDRYSTNAGRLAYHGELEPVLNQAFQRKTTRQWLESLSPHFLIAPLNTIDQMPPTLRSARARCWSTCPRGKVAAFAWSTRR
jgi:CoA:oxalate CoA-transferase